MAKNAKTKNAAELSPKHEEILGAIMCQLDVIVTGLCDLCCVSNYFRSQGQDMWNQLIKLSPAQIEAITGFSTTYDISGSNYADDDSDLPLVGDTIEIDIVAGLKPYASWGGHLKSDLRGTPNN